MKRSKWTIALTGTAVVVLAFIWSALPASRGSARTPPFKAIQLPAQGAALAPASGAGVTRAEAAGPTNYREVLKSSTDYWALAHALLPAAKAGDRDAQYYLFRIDRDCHAPHSWFVAPRGKLVSLDEALRSAAGMQVKAAEVKLFYSRCSQFYSNDTSELGNPRDWLERATEAGQPLAEATTAELRLGQEQQKLMMRAGAQPMADALLPPIGGDADPRDLLRRAIQSRDPEVFFEIGSLQKLLNPTQPRSEIKLNHWAWLALACQHGLDCADYGEPVPLPCAPSGSDCGTVPAMLLSWADNNWAPVEERVQQINAALDAGQWDQLGLGATSQ